jgi:hypothetical protein
MSQGDDPRIPLIEAATTARELAKSLVKGGFSTEDERYLADELRPLIHKRRFPVEGVLSLLRERRLSSVPPWLYRGKFVIGKMDKKAKEEVFEVVGMVNKSLVLARVPDGATLTMHLWSIESFYRPLAETRFDRPDPV